MYNLAWWHICCPLKPCKNVGSNPLILEKCYKNKEGNGLSLFQSTCPSQQLWNWLDKSFIGGRKSQRFLKRPLETMQGTNWSLFGSQPDALLHQRPPWPYGEPEKGEQLHGWLVTMNCSGSSGAWKPKQQQTAFVLDIYWESAIFHYPLQQFCQFLHNLNHQQQREKNLWEK